MSTAVTSYIIGHGAYGGANRLCICQALSDCILELESRNLPFRTIIDMICNAATVPGKNYGYATGVTADGLAVVELNISTERANVRYDAAPINECMF